MKEKKKHLQFTIDDETLQKLNKWSYRSGMTKACLIRASIRHCLKMKGY